MFPYHFTLSILSIEIIQKFLLHAQSKVKIKFLENLPFTMSKINLECFNKVALSNFTSLVWEVKVTFPEF